MSNTLSNIIKYLGCKSQSAIDKFNIKQGRENKVYFVGMSY